MFEWLKSKPKQPNRLVRLLKDYLPFTPVHVGRTIKSSASPGPILTTNQCFDNLHQYTSTISARLKLLGPILAGLDIDIKEAYAGPFDFVNKLHRALLVELPSFYRRELIDYSNYELSDRADTDICLSFLNDLAMLEADVMMKAKPGCFVGLNLDRTDRNMTMYRKPCLLGLSDRLFPEAPDTFCLEELWFSYLSGAGRGSLAGPDAIVPATYVDVIGGWMLIRLDRYIVAPDLDERLRTTWLGNAAG